MIKFHKFVYTPAGSNDITLAIAACRAGGIGIINKELASDTARIPKDLDLISKNTRHEYGLKLEYADENLLAIIGDFAQKGLRWLILDAETVPACQQALAELKRKNIRIVAEVRTPHWPGHSLERIVDGLILKGNESGGFIGEYSSFILLQKWKKQTQLPLFIRGGVTPYVAAACSALGVAGGVLDSQVLLLNESPFVKELDSVIGNLSGTETVAVGDGEAGLYFRLLVRPGHNYAQAFCAEGERQNTTSLKQLLQDRINWREPAKGIIPIGQDICFAPQWRKQYGHISAVFRAIDSVVEKSVRQTTEAKPFSKDAPLAQSFGISLPLVQGPMARISDRPEFAGAISQNGALPVLALSVLKGTELKTLLAQTKKTLGDKTWGIGLLGFVPQTLLDEQLEAAKTYHPKFAIIAGGRPDQALKFENAGIRSFLNVPSSKLIPFFIQEGARCFIFEGRECGGHIGPLSSFVLWSSMIDCLIAEIDKGKVKGQDIQVLFAGGIHDAVSSAMVQVLAAPLVNKGIKIGALMGTAYLYTKEIMDTGAIVPAFQNEMINCEHTVDLKSGPGHASRCSYTPFARTFLNKRQELHDKNMPVDEARTILDDLIMGRLRIAAKGEGFKGKLKKFDENYQRREGMYMTGQVAILRSATTDIDKLHREITSDALSLLSSSITEIVPSESNSGKPVDIAIIGIASILPKAATTQDFWENILNKVDAITEIPTHRWDWRLYYNEDRFAKDKVYSKWGGFLDDIAFDPTHYGIPPKSIESIDPMQLMALEVARRTLDDAGYKERAFDREHTSVIIGISCLGDVAGQYGLRAELPRFQGTLPATVDKRLPEWTEDTFAGILPNVVAGRIANRLNLGGLNFTTDAACASSSAAIYQGIAELAAGRSNLVITGGVDTSQSPFGYMCFSKTQALSPRGLCRTFDTSADGIVISEGIAMIALKRLEDAERDGDRIYAVIKGIGGSSDGRAKGLTAPLPEGQLRAMRRAYEQANFGPDTVGLFEAHGTGTVTGDTAELESTTSLLKQAGAKPRQAAIGSVKTILGHTKASAGVVGLIKATLALYHHVLPPHFGVEQPNEVLQQTDSPLYLTDEAMPWLTQKDLPRRAAVSTFGFGGTNFHIALEEYRAEYRPWLCPAISQRWPAELLLWSSTDRKELIDQLVETQKQLKKIPDIELRDLAFSLSKIWQAEAETIALIATDAGDLVDKIGVAISYMQGSIAKLPKGIYHKECIEPDAKVAVLFSGQGSQYINMFRELAVNFPIFAETLAEADNLLRDCFAARFGEDARLSHFIFPRSCMSGQARAAALKALTRTDVTQPALGAVEAGLWRFMCSLGLEPDMLGGHSYGEFTALFAGGFYDFDVLMALSEARGRFIIDTVSEAGGEPGTMAACQTDRETVEKAISGIDGVIVANHNAPQECVLSGSIAAVRKAVQKLSEDKVIVNEIPVAAAFHSPFVAPAQPVLANLIEKTAWHKNKTPVYSNTTGEPHANTIQQVKQTMTNHLVSPVEFTAQIENMYRDGARVFIELGPRNILTRLVERILKGRHHKTTAIDANNGGITGMLHFLGELLCAGVKLDINKLYEGRDCLQGDPAVLSRIQRLKPVSKHAWMINGSGVRRAGEPIKQIGIREEDLNSLLTGTTQGEMHIPAKTTTNWMNSSKLESKQTQQEGSFMENRKPGSVIGDQTIMTEYFKTMRQFLEAQERIMTMYMRGATFNQRSVIQPPRHIQRERFLEKTEPEHNQAILKSGFGVQQETSAEESNKISTQVKAPGAPYIQTEPNAASGRVGTVKPEPANTLKDPAESFDLKKIADILLTIVEDKTGYPPDMVGLDQNLEADLGIDSIKRIEIIGELLNTLPQGYSQALGEERTKLNTQPTFQGMLDLLGGLKVEGRTSATLPFDQAGMRSTTRKSSRPFRHIIKPKQEAIDTFALKRLGQGHFIITQDKLGVAETLSEILYARDCTVSIVQHEILKDENLLNQWCASLKSDIKTIAGIIHLTQLGSNWLQTDAPVNEWRSQLQLNNKSLFTLLNYFSAKLNEDAHILSASALGGLFNREIKNTSGLSLQGGEVGLLKSLVEEHPKLRVKAIDIDPGQPLGSIATTLMNELELAGGRLEVGYPDGKRTIFQTEPHVIDAKDDSLDTINSIVVLATGGLKGITAELLRELALPNNTLIVTGRSPLTEDTSDDLQTFDTPAALRQHFIAEVRKGRLQLTPAEIQRKVQSIVHAREMRNNIQDFRQRGAQVEYHQVDVTDDDAMRQLFDLIYNKHTKIDGVVHGAGVIEDKLLADKTNSSWSWVVETKIIGFLLLQKYLRPKDLRFFTVLSSVAGRYGNSGQTDYATANELMNRLACQLSSNWENKVNLKALCWGPWGPTAFGTGMVTEDTESKFAEKGVGLVSAEAGRSLFKAELTHSSPANIEIICGEGPWEQREAAMGIIERHAQDAAENILGPLLYNAATEMLPQGDQIATVVIDGNHAYLTDHCIDAIPVLPAAVALEFMAEAAAHFWPGWVVIEARECRLLKGIELKEKNQKLTVKFNPPQYGSSDGFEVNADISSGYTNGNHRIHYRSILRFEQQVPDGFKHKPPAYTRKKVAVTKAYNEWLFHGPRFQVFEKIYGLSEEGAKALLKTTSPAQWMENVGPKHSQWIFDPAVVDAAAQMAILWTRSFCNQTALPTRFGRIVRYSKSLPEQLYMNFERIISNVPDSIRANVYFSDTEDNILLLIEDMECVSSTALNRLGGTAKIHEKLSA